MLRYIYFFAAIVLFTSCQPSEQTIKIITTTDVHGSFFPTDLKTGEEKPLSLARVQSFVQEEREKPDQEVILLDNGDIIQGDPLVYYYSFEKTDVPHICAQVLNYMDYDAATIGNHDIEAGHPVYDKLLKESEFPWLAANAVRTDNGEPYFEPYHMIEKNGVEIAALGLITPHIPHWLPPQIWSGMEFVDMVESAEHWVSHIKEVENPDLLIGLFHAGVDYTYNNQDAETYKNENAVQLVAEQVEGFDIIFCGHDHKTWNKKVKGPDGENVLILGSRSKAWEVAVAEISMIRNGRSWEIAMINGANQKMGEFEADSLFMEEFLSAQSEVSEYVSRPIGTLQETISSRDAFFGSSAFIDLIHQVQLDVSGADISFAAPLSMDIELHAGEMIVDDMFDLYRYENLLYTMQLSGREILNYLNFSYAGWFETMNSTADHLIKLSEGQGGRFRTQRAFYNFDSALGLIYEVDVTKPENEMVKIISMADGSEFHQDKKYTVAVNSYRGNGGGNHLTFGAGIPTDELQGRIVNSTDKDLRYYMMKWIEEKGVINPEARGQWKVVPEEYYRAGKARDYPILFRN